MPNPQKRKGTDWERDATKLLNERFPDTWKRIALSGALGTQLNMPLLMPDVRGKYYFLPKDIVGECKVGYGGKQMTIQKEWFDGIHEIAEKQYAIPAVLLKFEKSRKGVKHIICLDFDTWDTLMTQMGSMYNELKTIYEKLGQYEPELLDE